MLYNYTLLYTLNTVQNGNISGRVHSLKSQNGRYILCYIFFYKMLWNSLYNDIYGII